MPTTGAASLLPLAPNGSRRAGVARRVARFVGRNWARLGYAYHVEPTWLAINQLTFPVRGLAPALSGVRVAHLSDFHCGPHIPDGYLESVVARTADQKPDLVALTGDFIDRGPEHAARAARLFRHLKAPLGVFAVLGNHDFSVHTPRGVCKHPGLDSVVTDALRAEGVTVLRNRSVVVTRGEARLVVAGVDDLWSGRTDPGAALGGACEHTPRLLLAHNPESAAHLDRDRADVILSGHTHGGQINWPGLGRLFLHKSARRWAAGAYTVPSGHLYVTTGVGFGWRFRFGVRPELALITLEPASS